MTRIRRLKLLADISARERGHQLTRFKTLEHLTRGGRNVVMAEAECKICARSVIVDTHGCDVGGEAIALGCT